MVFDSPCDADLDSMPSFDGGRRRFCSDCMRSVHMLSEMTRAEAEAVMRTESGACMSYRRGADGRLVFKAARALVPAARLLRGGGRMGERRDGRGRACLLAVTPVFAALAACTAPPASTPTVDDDIELGARAQDYAGYQAIPEQRPGDATPAAKPAPNNEPLIDGKLPELGLPGSYGGGVSLSAYRGHGKGHGIKSAR